jgi:iron(III) transport system permease protein
MSRISSVAGHALLCVGLAIVVGWPAAATFLEAARVLTHSKEVQPGSGMAIDAAGSEEMLREQGGVPRPLRLAMETAIVVAGTEALALPLGILIALLLFRTDVPGRGLLLAVLTLAAFVPLPLHATAWLGALGNAGRLQALGAQPILVGRFGAAVVQALAALPWVVLIVGVGLCGVESELEESALLEYGPMRVLLRVTLRRSVGAIAGAALAVAVLAAGDMTVTDLLQIRTYAEEAFLQYTLGKGPGEAALVALPPFLLLGVSILFVGRALGRLDPARVVSSLERARRWRLGTWRIPLGILLIGLVGNMVALPLYSLVWRAGRVGGKATLGRPPTWSAAGLLGTLQYAAAEIWEPLTASLLWTALAATLAAFLAFGLGWAARRSMIWSGVAMVTLALTLATPGPIAGMALILAYQPYAIIADTGAILVMAEVFRSLPYAILILWPFLCSFPAEYLEAAALDGLTPSAQMLRLVLPLSWRAILAAWAVAFAIGLGELPATNLVTPPGVPPVSYVIWSLLHTGVESHLSGVALIMLAVVAAAGLLAAVALRSLRRLEGARSVA